MTDDRCPRCLGRPRPGTHFCTLCGARLTPPISGDVVALRFRTARIRRQAL